jgi:hypothetical protein
MVNLFVPRTVSVGGLMLVMTGPKKYAPLNVAVEPSGLLTVMLTNP